jgi:hypothetical protein
MRKATMIMSRVLGTLLIGGAVLVQEPPAAPPAYGEQISMKQAMEPAQAAVSGTQINTIFMAIAAVFPSGDFAYIDGKHPVCINQRCVSTKPRSLVELK